MLLVSVVATLTRHSSQRLAEVGFLLILIAGVWLAAAQVPQLRFAHGRTIVAGILIAVGALLEIIAIHWGSFG
jgi:hypothetical protein